MAVAVEAVLVIVSEVGLLYYTLCSWFCGLAQFHQECYLAQRGRGNPLLLLVQPDLFHRADLVG